MSVVVALLAGLSGVASGDAASESAFVSDTNSARAADGLPAYAVSGDLTAAARRWAAHMAATRTLEHNPQLGSSVCCWRDLGDNVGRGSSEPPIERAFMSSPEHRAHILSSTYTQIGVGTARGSDGLLYVDELFRRPMHASQPVSAPAPPRASRNYVRAPRVSTPPDALVVLRQRLRVARRETAHARSADPVGQALAYVFAMGVVTR